jgi:hypothetical protein
LKVRFGEPPLQRTPAKAGNCATVRLSNQVAAATALGKIGARDCHPYVNFCALLKEFFQLFLH